jgi:alpha-galactosidase
LESLSGRNVEQGNSLVQAYKLHEDFAIVDKIITNLTDHFGMVDTMYGSSVYMPIEAGAHYRVSANHAGLIARPVNHKGEQAILRWDK